MVLRHATWICQEIVTGLQFIDNKLERSLQGQEMLAREEIPPGQDLRKVRVANASEIVTVGVAE